MTSKNTKDQQKQERAAHKVRDLKLVAKAKDGNRKAFNNLEEL